MRARVVLWTAAICVCHSATAFAAERSATAGRRQPQIALPAPTEAEAFTFSGDVVMNGLVVGKCSFSAQAKKGLNGQPQWSLTESLSLGEGTAAMSHAASAWLDRNLQPLQGQLRTNQGGEPKSYTWRSIDEGYLISEWRSKFESDQVTIKDAGTCLTTVAAVILLARMTLAEKAEYETRQFDPAYDPIQGEMPFAPITLQNHGSVPWQGRQAIQVSGRRDKSRFMLTFEPNSRALLAFHMQEPDSVAIECVPRGTVKPQAPHTVLAKSADTPRAAALTAALALATADNALLDKTIHWPTFRARLGNAIPAELTPDQFRSAILAQFAATNVNPQPVAVASGVLSAIGDQLKIAGESESLVHVTFPTSFQNLRLTVQRIEGTWYLVGLGQ
jgi:hypothetical protein